MIFGFNTDIKHDDTVYHVQSEAREGELLLQTQVFMRGRCIGKRAVSYAEQAASGSFTDQQKEEILREQHRLVLDSIRDSKLNSVLNQQEAPEELAATKELDVHWLNRESVHAGHSLQMQMRVTDSGAPVPNARLTVRFSRADAAPFYAQVVTNAAGEAEMKIDAEEADLPDSSMLVQASFDGRTATRKFNLKKIEA